MSPTGEKPRKFIDLGAVSENRYWKGILKVFEPSIERALSLQHLNHAYAIACAGDPERTFFDRSLASLRVRYSVSDRDVDGIPDEGPLIMVANHPFGGIEGVILADILTRVRPDVRILGNYLLHHVRELRPWVISVDPFDNKESTAMNAKSLKEILRWLKGGGALITFPAGEVSHMGFGRWTATDSPWSPHIAAIARHTKATVQPVFFPGRNSMPFQLAGMVHPVLRTGLLPHELANKRGTTLPVRIGRPIPRKMLSTFETDQEAIHFLRISTYFLKNRTEHEKKRFAILRFPGVREPQPIIDPLPRDEVCAEVDALPADALLSENKDFSVYLAEAGRIPTLLKEVGRLREITFREVQEGTGKAVDLDRFDEHYLHLLLWDRELKQLAGAYRLGLTDKILETHGRGGLYTSTLFKFKPGFLKHSAHGIEFGRSFIRSEYQRKPSCLSMLWRGIGELIVRNPQYKLLFGPVSISSGYHAVSKDLMVKFLRQNRLDRELSRFVRARHPYRSGPIASLRRRSVCDTLRDMEDVSLLISGIEKDGKGIPVLLRQYLKLNATLVSFNVDRQFSNCVDGLILVDLTTTDPRILKRFLGKEGSASFAAHHSLSSKRDAYSRQPG